MAIQSVFGNEEVYKCEKCGHTWMKRGDERPLICPKCKTARWNKPKKKYFFSQENSRLRNNVANLCFLFGCHSLLLMRLLESLG